jgi:hypothetical protein
MTMHTGASRLLARPSVGPPPNHHVIANTVSRPRARGRSNSWGHPPIGPNHAHNSPIHNSDFDPDHPKMETPND